MAENQKVSRVELILQALLSAESSLVLARKLLRELDVKEGRAPVRSQPGVVGTYDGNFMVTQEGKKYQVPANYASKTKIAFGDKLKMLEEEGKRRFKQIDSVAKYKTDGVLAKKDGKWVVVTADGSYAVLPAAVKHFQGHEGDQFEVLLPKENKKVPFAAIDNKVGGEEKKAEEIREEAKPAEKTEKPEEKVEKKKPVKKKVEKKSETDRKKEAPKKMSAKPKREVKEEVAKERKIPTKKAEEEKKVEDEKRMPIIEEDDLR